VTPSVRLAETARHGYRLARAVRHGFVREDSVRQFHPVTAHDLSFPAGEAAYNGLGAAADGAIYFAVSTKRLDAAGRIFTFDPPTSTVRVVADLDEELGDRSVRAIPHGKVHVELTDVDGRLHGATHVGFYELRDGIERPAAADGYATYPGGRFFALQGGRLLAEGAAPVGEGIITMSADAVGRRLHALTWPGARYLVLDLANGSVRDHGPVAGEAESGSPRVGTWQRVCRSLGVVPGTDDVFLSDGAGRIVRRRGDRAEHVATLPRREMWRTVRWDPATRVFYGLTWNSAVLFSFDPVTSTCRELGTLGAEGIPPGRGGTLAFVLDRGSRTIHYLEAGGGLRRGLVEPPLIGTVWYVTHDLASGVTRTHGALRLGDGRWITEAQSLLLAGGVLYTSAGVEVSNADRSGRARELRARRAGTHEHAVRGYAEEIALVTFAPARGDA